MIATPQHVPADVQELIDIVQSAHAERTALQFVGGGTKCNVGFPQRNTSIVAMTQFDRLIDYDPAELVMTVGAGMRLTAIETLLGAHNQMLAFEPFEFAAAIDGTAGASTIGGIVGAGFAGSRRLSAGNVRDHVLGFTAVSGRGERFVAGGRVVKNVTGYDLSKLMCGSWGQLAALTEITLKVLPRPRTTVTLILRDLDDERAYALMTRAVRSQCEIAAAAYLPDGVVDPQSITLVRLEGFGPSVEARAHALCALVSDMGATQRASDEESASLWSAIPRQLRVDPSPADTLWRICIPSTAGVRVCALLREWNARFCVDWGGGLLWARLEPTVEHTQLRTTVEAAGGHATLLDAPADYRSRVCAQHPESPGVAALTQRVKSAFDPSAVLDPQRFLMPSV